MFVCPTISELRFYGCCHPCSRYEDGRSSTQQFMSTCIPKKYTQPVQAFDDYVDTVRYERNGPYFFVKEEGKKSQGGREGTLGMFITLVPQVL